MKQIRKNVFETNSSSTHSIAIPNKKFREYPNVIDFGFGDFGWETDEQDPADYLYTAIYAFYSDTDEREEKLNQLKSALDYYDIRYTFEEPRIDSWGDIQGYVDHAGELDEVLTAVFADDETFEFTDLKFSITGYEPKVSEYSMPYSLPVSGFEVYTEVDAEAARLNFVVPVVV